jgi:hypothetical protein
MILIINYTNTAAKLIPHSFSYIFSLIHYIFYMNDYKLLLILNQKSLTKYFYIYINKNENIYNNK